MTTGKVPNVRRGQELYGTAGMAWIFIFAILLQVGVLYFIAFLITAAVHVKVLSPEKPTGIKRELCWIIPQIVGLGITGFGIIMLEDVWLFALLPAAAYVFSIIMSYKLVPFFFAQLFQPLPLVLRDCAIDSDDGLGDCVFVHQVASLTRHFL